MAFTGALRTSGTSPEPVTLEELERWTSTLSTIGVVGFGGEPAPPVEALPDLETTARQSRRRNWEALKDLASY
jgi:hypothetical protein